MAESRRRSVIALIVVLAIVVAGAPAVAQLFSNPSPVTGPVPVVSPSGMNVTVTGSADVGLSDPFPDSETVDLKTSKGNATFSSSGDANLSVNADEITGTWTNVSGLDVSSNSVTINPEDKDAATIGGAATDFDFREMAVDDGQTDFVVEGPDGSEATVGVGGLPPNTAITAIDSDSGKAVGSADTDSNGDLSITIHLSAQSVRLVTGDQTNAPQLSNADPVGGQQSEPTELSVDVSDADFDEDSVDVTIDLDGSQISSQTISANQSVTTSNFGSLAAGEHTWTVEATDQFGQTTTQEYTFSVPDTLYIRNETNASQLVDSPVNVTVRFFGEDEVFTRETDTGTLDMTGLPVTEDFVVDVEASENYTSRTVFIRSIFEQQSVYLLNNTASTIETRFTLNDPTGQFGGSSVLYISKPINQSGTTEFRTVYADEFGVEGVTAVLEADERYRISIESEDGDLVQDMGPYRSDVSEEVELRPSGPTIEFDGFEQGWNAGAELNNRTLTARYVDPANETDSLTIYIHEFGNESNQLRPNESYFDLGELQTQYILTENESEKQWAVKFIINRDGDDLSEQVIVSNRPQFLPTGLDEAWRLIVGIGLLVMFAGAFSVLNRGVGAIMLGVMGGILWWSGFLTGATTGVAVVIALFVAIVFNIYLSR